MYFRTLGQASKLLSVSLFIKNMETFYDVEFNASVYYYQRAIKKELAPALFNANAQN